MLLTHSLVFTVHDGKSSQTERHAPFQAEGESSLEGMGLRGARAGRVAEGDG